MSAETVNTLAAAGTFVVITVTAIAALIQLRHMRLSNQLQALLELTDRWNGQSLQRSVTYVIQELPNKVSSPEYERSLRATAFDYINHPELALCSWWEQVGSMVKFGLIPKDPLLDLAAENVSAHWDALALTVGIVRATRGPQTYINFEYLGHLGKKWMDEHPGGDYPSRAPRLPIPAHARPLEAGTTTRNPGAAP